MTHFLLKIDFFKRQNTIKLKFKKHIQQNTIHDKKKNPPNYSNPPLSILKNNEK